MADDECKGTWSGFNLRYDKEPDTEVSRGRLEIEEHGSSNSIKGQHKHDGNATKFRGFCKPKQGGSRLMSFTLEMDGARFLFVRGVIQPKDSGRRVDGTFFVTEGIGVGRPRPAGPTPEPGDTGTWGGSQPA